MSILGTFNGSNVLALPSDALPRVLCYSSVEWNPREAVESNASVYTGQVQTYDYMNSWWEGSVSFPPMDRLSADAWSAFILSCRGQVNCFLMGDPLAKLPKGSAFGSPVVHGAGQTGYSLVTSGWTPNQPNLLMFGDYISIPNGSAYRLYRVQSSASSDGSGNATLSIWPNLRDLPADGTAIVTRNCKGVFRLAQSTGNKFSVNPGSYGFTGLAIREAI